MKILLLILNVHYKNTDLKGLVICRSQQEAMMYKAVFDRIGKLSAEIVPGQEEGRGICRKSFCTGKN